MSHNRKEYTMALSMDEDAQLTQLLGELEPEMGGMSQWAQGFLKDQIDRHRKYGTDIFMSPKQWAMIRKLHDEHVGSGSGSDDPAPLDGGRF